MSATENSIYIKKPVRIAFINLLIVALLGVIMRFKIGYSLPFINQKHFLEAHEHFAFSGWVTQILMVLMMAFLYNYLPTTSLKKYKRLIFANLICAYGMLVSFAWDGYGIISVLFFSLSILVSYLFAVVFWVDCDKIKTKIISVYWFKAALIFSVLSSFGPFFIAYMMFAKIQHPTWFPASTYYFLHFQYNGWFFFTCMGLLNEHIKSGISILLQKKVFWLFASACIPAYFLSALWLPIPTWLYIIVVLGAAAQVLGWVMMLKSIINNRLQLFDKLTGQVKWLFILSASALSIKLVLQLGSTVPALSKLAFGFRPVVIGFLHLMFLGVISLFIIGFCRMNRFILTAKAANTGIVIFVSGIILNEILLMVQGFSYMNYISVPLINELLLGAAVCMFTGILLLNFGLRKTDPAGISNQIN